MSTNKTEQMEGKLEQIGGVIRKDIGLLLGNDKMIEEGRQHELQGKAVQEAARAGERAEGRVEEVVGFLKNKAGKLTDNEQLQAEGKREEEKGKAHQTANE